MCTKTPGTPPRGSVYIPDAERRIQSVTDIVSPCNSSDKVSMGDSDTDADADNDSRPLPSGARLTG